MPHDVRLFREVSHWLSPLLHWSCMCACMSVGNAVFSHSFWMRPPVVQLQWLKLRLAPLSYRRTPHHAATAERSDRWNAWLEIRGRKFRTYLCYKLNLNSIPWQQACYWLTFLFGLTQMLSIKIHIELLRYNSGVQLFDLLSAQSAHNFPGNNMAFLRGTVHARPYP